ncbi:MAG TPA: hypothetical protein VFZ59_14135 [Verrucomicrobiae bacterium]|nr:hypothetical protein [Verrucomicrobiae bacterium]
MKSRNWCAGVGSSLLLAVTATAGPLQQSNVMNDPAWVIHLDLDALRQTSIGKQLLVEMEKPDAQKKFEAFQTVFNLDPRKDLHGVTLYSATKSDADGVALAYADFDAERLIALAQGNKDYEVSAHGTNKIHSWIDEKKKSRDGEPVRTYGALYKGKTLILGQRQDRISAALDVLDGKQPNLAASKIFAPLGTGGGVFLTGGARTWELPANDLGASVLKQAKLIWLNAQETEGKAELKLTVETTNAEIAKQLGDVCRGLVAVLALQTDKPEAMKLAKAIAIDQEPTGNAMFAKLSLPVVDLVEMIKSRAGK